METFVTKEPGIYPLKKALAQAIIQQAGIFAITFHNKIDYRYGIFLQERYIEGEPEKMRAFDMKFKFWLTDGKAVSATCCIGKGIEHDHFLLSTSTERDPERPKNPQFPNAMTQKCHNPFCDNLVDRAKKKSGACCRKCLNYECTHPACIQRAKDNGWKRATHSWETKIGKAHLSYRKT